MEKIVLIFSVLYFKLEGKSYHPYCAYNAYDYNCPVVPAENSLPVEIRAGVMYEDGYFKH